MMDYQWWICWSYHDGYRPDGLMMVKIRHHETDI